MNVRAAAQRCWDVIVVGAGPAGAVAARQLAIAGASVLLVDKAPLGRWKVCGCCLNGAAIETLRSLSLDGILAQHGAVPLQTIRIAAERCQASLAVTGVSLAREVFDAELIRAAISVGAVYLSQTHAMLGGISGSHRKVVLSRDHVNTVVQTKLVLAAVGLGGRFLTHEKIHSAIVRPDSYIGAGMVADVPFKFVEPGTIYMACAKGGYIGLVRLEDGRMNVAAALAPNRVRSAGGPGPLAAQILSQVGWHEGGVLAEANWRGTPALTRDSTQLDHERVLVLGDAAGYIEPFTGEGMAWALDSAVTIAPLALEAIECWSPRVGEAWRRLHHSTVARRQTTCRHVAWGLRHPWFVRAAVKLLRHYPRLAQPVIRRLSTHSVRGS